MSIVEKVDIGDKYFHTASALTSFLNSKLKKVNAKIPNRDIQKAREFLDFALEAFGSEKRSLKSGAYISLSTDILEIVKGRQYKVIAELEEDLRSCREIIEDFPEIDQKNLNDYRLARKFFAELLGMSARNRYNQQRYGKKSKYSYEQ